jgi:hypothetical protein
MKWDGLIVDRGTGQVSGTKLWMHIAYAAATIAFLKQAWMGTLNADIWLFYMGVVGTHTAISKLISLRYGAERDVRPYEPD